MGDVNALRDSLEQLAIKYEGREFTPQLVVELRTELDQFLAFVSNELFYVNDKFQQLEGIEIMPKPDGKIKLLLTWNPTLYHQSYREVKNYIHNTIGLNEKTFMSLIEMEVEKLFKRLDENGKLDEIIQAQMFKYLGSYKANLSGHYNQSYRLRELVSGYLAEQVKESLIVDVKIKGDERNGQK